MLWFIIVSQTSSKMPAYSQEATHVWGIREWIYLYHSFYKILLKRRYKHRWQEKPWITRSANLVRGELKRYKKTLTFHLFLDIICYFRKITKGNLQRTSKDVKDFYTDFGHSIKRVEARNLNAFVWGVYVLSQFSTSLSYSKSRSNERSYSEHLLFICPLNNTVLEVNIPPHSPFCIICSPLLVTGFQIQLSLNKILQCSGQSELHNSIKNPAPGQECWHMPAIPALWKAEIGELQL